MLPSENKNPLSKRPISPAEKRKKTFALIRGPAGLPPTLYSIKGAIIATEPGGDLTLNTGPLSFEEIHDKNKSSDWHAGISGSMSFEGGSGQDEKILA